MPEPPRGKDELLAIGQSLREYCSQQGLDREVLAARSGVPPSTIRALEHGEHDPDDDTLVALTGALGLGSSMLHARATQRGDDLKHRIDGRRRHLRLVR